MDLVATLQSELETLRSRMKVTFFAKRLLLLQHNIQIFFVKTKEKGNGSVLKNGVLEGHGKKKNKLRDLGYGTMMHHSKRYVALKVMYFGLRIGSSSIAVKLLKCELEVEQKSPCKTISLVLSTKDVRSQEGPKEENRASPCLYGNSVLMLHYRFYGFASEAQMDPTVEGELFKALERTRLIFGDKKELQYSRCGRTDKGVSSVGQVREIDYVRVLNRVLPNDIRIMGWSPIPVGFSARFSCLSRVYKYFFWQGNLNITAMQTAAEKFLGEHDFRNFCKMDADNVHNYRRHIISFEILPFNESDNADQLMIMKIKGSAFLWHQVRCMVAILFLIGQGLESPNVIDLLLDIERTPRKPQFPMAPEIPLVLQSSEFEGLKFICSSDTKQALNEHLERECRSHKLQSAIFHEALLNSSCIEIDNNISSDHTKKKGASHIPLLSRPTEPSYEERRKKVDA
ncbi:hypothetical protein RDI58_011439 [Solanum bulbocastanum]|uniref:tRNA pseudouridine synthase n=1 Tax=Solanum bulbocastanum TaxID=147425 RepID=A0AAN8YKH2_SOLBU